MDGSDQLGSPFIVRRPAGEGLPLIFASPHSGRIYPAEMMAASGLDRDQIRTSEDAHVDALIEDGPRHGATVIANQLARAYVDVNRAPHELDPAMFEDELPAFAQGRSARVAAGLGAIARIVADGQEIYNRKLTYAEARLRIETVHAPYHKALNELAQEARARHGRVLIIDWHSMPSAAGRLGPGRACDFVLGDRFGQACGGAVTSLVERSLRDRGYKVVRNNPYAGGYTTEHYGSPQDGVHALQVEIDRGLYLDETGLAPGSGFATLKADLGVLFRALAAGGW
jgi:N-formylglutamate amidohydrolase